MRKEREDTTRHGILDILDTLWRPGVAKALVRTKKD
jgi:hypothetical protein